MTAADRLKVGAILAVGALLTAWAVLSPSRKPPPFDPLYEARMQCLLSIKRGLHDPGSAEFPGATEWPAERAGDGTISVLATYRAKNAFGAYRTALHRCKGVVAGASVTILPQR